MLKTITKRFISKLMVMVITLSVTAPLAFTANASIGTVYMNTNHLDGSYSIQKLDGTAVGTGSGVIETQFDLPASDGLGTGYQIIFSTVAGYTTPDTYYFNLSTGSVLHLGPSQTGHYKTGIYTQTGGQTTGTIYVYTNHPDGAYSIYKLDDTFVGSGGGVGVQQFDIPAQTGLGTGYKIVFTSLSEYNNPNPNPFYFNLSAGDQLVLGPDQTDPYKTGLYTPKGANGAINITVQDNATPANPVTDGSWTLYSCTDANNLNSCTTFYISGTASQPLTSVPAGIYGLVGTVTTGYSNVVVTTLNPQTLTAGGALNFTLQYTPATDAGTVEVYQISANGVLKLFGPTPATIANYMYKDTNSDPGSYTLNVATMPAGGLHVIDTVTDESGAVMAPPYTQVLTAGQKIVFTVKYKDIGDKGTVTVNQNVAGGWLQLNGPTSSEITSQTYFNSNSGAGDYSLDMITAPAGYALDSVTDNSGTVLSSPYPQTLANGGSVAYNINYIASTGTGTINVTVEDDAQNQITNGSYTLTDDDTPPNTYNGTESEQWTVMPVGDYTLTAIIPAVTPPELPYTQVSWVPTGPQGLTDGGTLDYTVTYTRPTGAGIVNISVTDENGTAINNGNWTLSDGTNSMSGTESDSIYALPGAYTLTAQLTAGYVSYAINLPAPQTLTAGGVINYEIIYTRDNVGDIVIIVEDDAGNTVLNGDWTLTNTGVNPPLVEMTGSSDQIISMLAGNYEVTAVIPAVSAPELQYTDVTVTPSGPQAHTAGSTLTFTVTYTRPANSGTVNVNIVDNAGSQIAGATWTLTDGANSLNGTLSNTFTLISGSYDLTNISAPSGYTLTSVSDNAGTPLSSPYTQALASGGHIWYEVVFTPIAGTESITVNQVGANGTLDLTGPFSATITTSSFTNASAATGDYTLTNFTAPAGFVLTSVTDGVGTVLTAPYAQTLAVGTPVTYNVNWTAVVTSESVTVNQAGATGTLNLIGPSPAYVTTATYTNISAGTGDYTLTDITAPAGFILSSVTDAVGTALTAPYAQTLAVGTPVIYNVAYVSLGAQADPMISGFALSASSNQPTPGAVLTYEINYGNLDTANTATGVTIDIDYDEVNGAVNVPAGCADNTPSAGIMRCDVADIPAGAANTLAFAYTINPATAYGALLTHSAVISSSSPDSDPANNTASVTTAVLGALTLTKTASASSVGDNQLVTYTITLRKNTSQPGTLNFTLTDSFTSSDTITGPNGGTLTYLINSGSCTGVACSRQNINDGPISVALDNPGSEAVITYQARSNYSGIPVNGSSTITNTVTATDDANVFATLTSQHNVAVAGASSGGQTDGGGGGGGGGSIIYKGDMDLEITKMVSADGNNYTNAGKNISIAIPENKTTPLYTKILIKNSGKFSAVNIKFRHSFDEGKSDITANSITDVTGATLKGDTFTIDKVKVGETYQMSYKVRLTESGTNLNPAKDSVELISYKSSLPITQDGLTYRGIGDKFITYLFAGSVPASFDDGSGDIKDGEVYSKEPVSIKIQSAKTSAAPGDIVKFTLTVKNLTNKDLTSLFVDHQYDANAFSVVEAIGAKDDSSGIHWKRPLLRQNQTLTFDFSLKVKDSAPVNEMVRGLTSVLLSEYADIAPVENFMRIINGVPSYGTEERQYELAATGPAGILALIMMLSVLGYFGNSRIRNALYIRKKKLALAGI